MTQATLAIAESPRVQAAVNDIHDIGTLLKVSLRTAWSLAAEGRIPRRLALGRA